MTIYGPSTANFDDDEAFRPLLLTDWNHRSVFEDWPLMLESGAAPEMTNILINGTGQFGWGPKPEKYTLWLDEGKDHLLILVNTAVDSTFVFSIDHHLLEVVEMDFVPIQPYTTTNLKIGIGEYRLVYSQRIRSNINQANVTTSSSTASTTPTRRSATATTGCGPSRRASAPSSPLAQTNRWAWCGITART